MPCKLLRFQNTARWESVMTSRSTRIYLSSILFCTYWPWCKTFPEKFVCLFLRRGLLLLFEGTTDLATVLNTIATSFQFAGNHQVVMWCQDLHRLEPLTFSSKNAYLVFTMSDIMPFTPDGLIGKVEALSNLKGSFIAFSCFNLGLHFAYYLLSFKFLLYNCLMGKSVLISFRNR